MALNRHNQEPTMNIVGNFIKVNTSHTATAHVDIPTEICQKLPKTFLPQMIIGIVHAKSLIEQLRISYPDEKEFKSVVFRLLAAQKQPGADLILKALEEIKSKIPQLGPVQSKPVKPAAVPTIRPTTLAPSLPTTMPSSQPSSSTLNISKTVNQPNRMNTSVPAPFANSRQALDKEMMLLNAELKLLLDQAVFVQDPHEFLILSILKKSIFFDMGNNIRLKYSFQAQYSNPSQHDMKVLADMSKIFNDHFNQIQLPPGLGLIASAQRKSLDVYIEEYRRTRLARMQGAQQSWPPQQLAQSQQSQQSQFFQNQQSSIPLQVRNLENNEVSKSGLMRAGPSSSGTFNNVGFTEKAPISTPQRISLVEKKPSQSQEVIMIEDKDDDIEIEKGKSSSHLNDESSKGTAAQHYLSSNNSSKKDKIYDSISAEPKSPELNSIDDLISEKDATMITPRADVTFSDSIVDISFISVVRSLNESSSPAGSKRKASESIMESARNLETEVDSNWQEGFVQGLFYNFAIESPFGEFDDQRIDRSYLKGFKAALGYYRRKSREED